MKIANGNALEIRRHNIALSVGLGKASPLKRPFSLQERISIRLDMLTKWMSE